MQNIYIIIIYNVLDHRDREITKPAALKYTKNPKF
jgi:hypothetical protein